MSLHYAVISDFSFSGCRPSLIGLSFHTTKKACTKWPVPGSKVKLLCNKRIFPTQEEALSYIAYLYKRYPNSSVPFPVLDKGQLKLFQEVSIGRPPGV